MGPNTQKLKDIDVGFKVDSLGYFNLLNVDSLLCKVEKLVYWAAGVSALCKLLWDFLGGKKFKL